MAVDELILPQQEEVITDPKIKEMVEAGIFYGRKKSKTNPKMRPYILGNRNEIELINLYKTEEELSRALGFIQEKVKNSGLLLFVGVQPQAAGIAELAQEFGYPYVANRWLGGTLTNYKVISKRIEYFSKLKEDLKTGALGKYTKKEQVLFAHKFNRMEETMQGLEPMTRRPDVLIMIDPVFHMTAVNEARLLGISLVALLSTDADPDLVDFPVPGNTKSRASVDWFLGRVKEAIREARTRAPAAESKESHATDEGRSK